MKTIAIFAGYLLPHLGGIERYVDNLTKELVGAGYKVILISSNFDKTFKLITKNNGVTDIRVPIYKLFSGRYPLIKHNKDLKRVYEELDKNKIETIIVNTRFHLTSLLGARYGRKHNIPVFLVEHGSQHLTVNNKILDFFGAIYEHCLTSVVKRYVDYYYGVSKEACEWQKHFRIKSDGVWYNSISDFSKGLNIQKEKDGIINIVYAGRLLKQKGVVELLDSFVNLEKKHDNIQLTIAGDGDLFKQLKKEYSSKNIKFLGKVNFETLKEIYAYTDIFVYAPVWPEGLPTAILEAGLMECAVIGSPQGGIKEVITNNKNGLMVDNQESLQKSIELLINNKKKRVEYGKNLRKLVLSKFVWDITYRNIINDIRRKANGR